MLEEVDGPTQIDAGIDPAAERHEIRVQSELNAQFHELRRQARGIFEAVKGRIGARTEEYLQEVFAKASADYASEQFLMQRIGADRQMDLPLVATLTQLRSGLLDGIEHPTAADHMNADSAVVGYRNMLRFQGWLGSAGLLVERELFGQNSLDSVVGRAEATAAEHAIDRIETKLLPLIDRCQRKMIRALDRLEARRRGKPCAVVSVSGSGHVNVGSTVHNEIG